LSRVFLEISEKAQKSLITGMMAQLSRLEDVEKIKRIGGIIFGIPACRRQVSN
jgi:hypothetical protein